MKKRKAIEPLPLREVTERLLRNPLVRMGYERSGITALAVRVLGTPVAAARWITSPQSGLGEMVPADLLQTAEGVAKVKRLLKQMSK